MTPGREKQPSRSIRSSIRKAKTLFVSSRDRAKAVDGCSGTTEARGILARWIIRSSYRRRRRTCGHAVLAPYSDAAMANTSVITAARVDDLRRSLQARDGVPRDLAFTPAPARPRGVSGGRFLSSLTSVGACRKNVGRPRRRFADVTADHRDAGRRYLGVHSDERYFDHRRADLPRIGSFQLRSVLLLTWVTPFPVRRFGTEQGHEAGCTVRCVSTLTVPRTRSFAQFGST